MNNILLWVGTQILQVLQTNNYCVYLDSFDSKNYNAYKNSKLFDNFI